ncbi:hypothetical protein E2P81_ATG02864 [Venturia nashicola]|uniref:Uncharacterized protein n=1 Tax=Venturia nashicola TaxID=86259 RepID=A0A4Z1PLB6_9PEZI|nr:hypothetical protein E6O75_ATG02928 [Venturia nashicola]TLD35975.1 hypothetical protein E2P81_ATG02864 [Venturia nashicola]
MPFDDVPLLVEEDIVGAGAMVSEGQRIAPINTPRVSDPNIRWHRWFAPGMRLSIGTAPEDGIEDIKQSTGANGPEGRARPHFPTEGTRLELLGPFIHLEDHTEHVGIADQVESFPCWRVSLRGVTVLG